jgi:hypothetical protein
MKVFFANYGGLNDFHKPVVITDTKKKMLLAKMNGLMLNNGFKLKDCYEINDLVSTGSISDDYGWYFDSYEDFKTFVNEDKEDYSKRDYSKELIQISNQINQ